MAWCLTFLMVDTAGNAAGVEARTERGTGRETSVVDGHRDLHFKTVIVGGGAEAAAEAGGRSDGHVVINLYLCITATSRNKSNQSFVSAYYNHDSNVHC
jgi:hypothetical protein